MEGEVKKVENLVSEIENLSTEEAARIARRIKDEKLESINEIDELR
ncbi:hypothetical protein ACEN33_10290 [Ruoffia sp. FAM 24228]|nr:hypothetical protein [Ruoffia tabacinasalis]